MEFWLDVLERFCSPGDSLYCIFGGDKDNACSKCKLPSIFFKKIVIILCTFLQSF
jgi:hypothetical protein